jgi:pimeloyl-ACP methyl ester carboxylesterase
MRDSRHWGEFPDEFRRELPGEDVLCLDLPGNGSLHAGRSLAQVPEMARWCRGELQGRGLAPPYRVLAMSLGAMVAVSWAQSHPRDFAAAVLINTSLRPYNAFYWRLQPRAWLTVLRMAVGGPGGRAGEAAILRLTSRRHAADADLLETWTAWSRQQPVSRANALRQLLAAARFRAQPAPLRPPLLMLASRGDGLVDYRCSSVLARAWNCDLVLHPDAGHDLPLDDGPWVARQVRGWLERSLPANFSTEPAPAARREQA